MMNLTKIKSAVCLFFIALVVRIAFYLMGLAYFPIHIQRFVTADTIFYYDPLALKIASGTATETSLLSVTRFTFLGYLSLFYRYFGHWHLPVSLFHCFLGAFTVVFIFLTARVFLKEKAAFMAGLVAALQIVLVYWVPFVTTEALFLLFLSACLYLFGKFLKTKRSLFLFLVAPILIIMPLSRPLGITFSIFMILYLAWIGFGKLFGRGRAVIFIIFNILIFTAAILYVSRFRNKINEVITQDYPQTLLQMSLYIDEMPEIKSGKGHLKFYSARVSLPPGVAIPKIGNPPGSRIIIADIVSYFRSYYYKYFVLTACRIYTLFNPWVPEYSLKHNIFNLLFYGLMYVFSIIGLILIREKERAFANLLLICIASQVFLIALTLVDYDFRFRLPIELILTIPAGTCIYGLLNGSDQVFKNELS